MSFKRVFNHQFRLMTVALVLVACCISGVLIGKSVSAQKAGKVSKFSAPTLSCVSSTSSSITIKVTAGATGATAGVSIQWITAEAYANGPDNTPGTADDNSWPLSSDDPSVMCKASFSGNASGYYYNLAAGQSTTVTVGDVLFDTPGASSTCANTPLACGTEYVFRAFAHATSTINKSDFSANQTCRTVDCIINLGCTYTQGYWKSHGPIPTGNNVNEWGITSLTLGTVTYTDLELLSIFNNSGASNGLVKLAHQLIAAKINIAHGADDSAVAGDIAAADALIGSLVVPPVGSGSLSTASTSALVSTLTSYNEGLIGPGHCQ